MQIVLSQLYPPALLMEAARNPHILENPPISLDIHFSRLSLASLSPLSRLSLASLSPLSRLSLASLSPLSRLSLASLSPLAYIELILVTSRYG
jgi:hypothetical protein